MLVVQLPPLYLLNSLFEKALHLFSVTDLNAIVNIDVTELLLLVQSHAGDIFLFDARLSNPTLVLDEGFGLHFRVETRELLEDGFEQELLGDSVAL
jgi:hypothetical protein